MGTVKLALTAVVGLVLLFPPPAIPAQELLRLEKSADAMGSTYSIAVYGTDRVKMEAAIDAAFDEVRRLDGLLSNYKPESEWSEVNRDAAQKPVKVSAELFQLLEDCLRYSRESDGAFDITVGPLMKVWGFYKGSGHLPHRPEIQAAHGQGGLPAHQAGPGGPDGAVRPSRGGDRSRRHRQRVRGRPDGGCVAAQRYYGCAGSRVGQQHLRIGGAARSSPGAGR